LKDLLTLAISDGFARISTTI